MDEQLSMGASARHMSIFAAGIIVSIFTNFVLNDRWTWGDRVHATRSWLQRCAEFYIVSGFAALLQFSISTGVARVLTLDLAVGPLTGQQIAEATAVLLGIAIATPLNYVFNHFWTFRETEQAPPNV